MAGKRKQDVQWLSGEEWRLVAEAPGLQVSNLGRVRGPNGLRKPQGERKRKDCYLKVGVGNHRNGTWRNISIHVAVCEAWHGPKPSPEMEVCHRNGDCKDNRAENLRWGTSAYNNSQKRDHGTLLFGSRSPRAILNEGLVAEIRNAYAAGMEISDLVRRYEVPDGVIRPALIGRTWRHVLTPPVRLRQKPKKAPGPVLSKKELARRKATSSRLLSDEQVREMRALRHSGMQITQIGRIYGVDQPSASRIINGHSYTWVEE